MKNLTITSGHPFTDGPTAVPLHVLCVDDSAVCRQLVQVVLTRAGHVVTSAADGRKALELFEGGAYFDVLVTDHNMPRLDGLALVRKLRAHGFAGAIVVISAGLDDDDTVQYRALGVGAVLTKPVLIEQIRDAVRRAHAASAAPAVEGRAARERRDSP